jgi:hypothetical protein
MRRIRRERIEEYAAMQEELARLKAADDAEEDLAKT